MTGPPCRRCGEHPQALDTGWCAKCLVAEDERQLRMRQWFEGATELTGPQRRAAWLHALARDLEDALYRDWADDVEPWVLARDLDVPLEFVTLLLNRASARDIPWRRNRGTRPVRRTRVLATRQGTPTWAAQGASIALEEDVHWAGHRDGLRVRDCPICHAVFEPARKDQVCCSAKCRRLKHRVERGDPTAAKTVAWLRDPPTCEGCGEPLHGTRVGARFHSDTCRKRAARRKHQGPPTAVAQGASVGLDIRVHNPGNREEPDP
jgi:ribosomal protein L37E